MTKWLLAYVVISVALFSPQLFSGGDNCRYMILAESLATGRGYRDLHLVGEPWHRVFPPGMALLLLPSYLLFGRSLIAMKVVILITGLIGFVYYIRLTSILVPPLCKYTWALFLSVPCLILYNHWVLSEIPFLAVSMASIYYLLKGGNNAP